MSRKVNRREDNRGSGCACVNERYVLKWMYLSFSRWNGGRHAQKKVCDHQAKVCSKEKRRRYVAETSGAAPCRTSVNTHQTHRCFTVTRCRSAGGHPEWNFGRPVHPWRSDLDRRLDISSRVSRRVHQGGQDRHGCCPILKSSPAPSGSGSSFFVELNTFQKPGS